MRYEEPSVHCLLTWGQILLLEGLDEKPSSRINKDGDRAIKVIGTKHQRLTLIKYNNQCRWNDHRL